MNINYHKIYDGVGYVAFLTISFNIFFLFFLQNC